MLSKTSQTQGIILLNDSIDLWRNGSYFSRPKWGIYRKKTSGLKDEQVRFADFSVSELNNANADTSWGPFAGPWTRYRKNPIIRLEGKETYSIQNGPQSVIKWKDKWYMFLMTSQPMVTKLA